ncbi:MAG: carbamoyltransferase HypF [Deltaproteobacteria bacterium]|nr:carbamoyltransferase HypF [Deltaproteobacteria bacterium]
MMRRSKGTITGIVQGVGFRPFIYQLARRYKLSGHVINTSAGVDLEVEGPKEDIEEFFASMQTESPPLAFISSVTRSDLPLEHSKGFDIRESRAGEERKALISPDVSICADCLRELGDPGDRRYEYPFINCTNCGPRYTIIQDIPYDRRMTTMKKFTMCPACRKEYDDPENRRFHAQPNACWDCGPRVFLHGHDAHPMDCKNPVQETVRLLKEGAIVGIKGLGGFHLAVDAQNHKAVKRLRRRKHREEKPLGLMVKDLQAAGALAHIDRLEAEILSSHQRPIVLLRKRRFHGLSSQVAPKNRDFGIMLPYTPLHYLLMGGDVFKALVMTSGNITEEPINIENREAFRNLKGICDYYLTHDRDIYLRSDDSITRIVDGVPRQIRRSRGYVPVPIFLSRDMPELPPTLALGGELKNTLCLIKENRAFLSQHVGDMENLETYDFFKLTIGHLKRILQIEPEVLAHDMHPDYLSTVYARDRSETPTIAIQHHHAHIVSCLAENGVQGPVIGMALDGTGFGHDGQVWGGEILLADRVSFQRAAHLEYVPLPGGDKAAEFPWRMALSYLYKTYGENLFDLPLRFVREMDMGEANLILRMIQKRVNTPMTSSCGRLFDTVSALVGVRRENAYEGQAAIELEMCQKKNERGKYSWDLKKGKFPWVILTTGLIREIVDDLGQGTDKRVVSSRFHNTMVEGFVEICKQLRDETGLNEVAMSGGAFQNSTLTSGLTEALLDNGFQGYTHRLVPTNDGGISLGQAVCAGMRHGGYKGAFSNEIY